MVRAAIDGAAARQSAGINLKRRPIGVAALPEAGRLRDEARRGPAKFGECSAELVAWRSQSSAAKHMISKSVCAGSGALADLSLNQIRSTWML